MLLLICNRKVNFIENMQAARRHTSINARGKKQRCKGTAKTLYVPASWVGIFSLELNKQRHRGGETERDAMESNHFEATAQCTYSVALENGVQCAASYPVTEPSIPYCTQLRIALVTCEDHDHDSCSPIHLLLNWIENDIKTNVMHGTIHHVYIRNQCYICNAIRILHSHLDLCNFQFKMLHRVGMLCGQYQALNL